MKRKVLIVVLSVMCALMCAFGLTACADRKSDDKPSGGDDPIAPEQKVFKTVTFDVNGGDTEIDDMQFEVGKIMAALPNPTRHGYTFVCWLDTVDYEFTAASIMPPRDLQLTAKWEKIITSYDDEYVSFKPASSGVKDEEIKEYIEDVYGENYVEKYVYVELTSDDLGGVNKVGTVNNFTLRTLGNMEYKLKDGYDWEWFQGDFSTPNGAQRFTLGYGSNIQFVTIKKNGIVVQIYLLDMYVKRDYYINLYKNVFETKPYDSVRVVENERFSAKTATVNDGDLEFDKRVYFNPLTDGYEEYVYSTAVTRNWNLYQTYKNITITAETDGGTLDGELKIKPYTRYFTLPSPNKKGYDFLGWQMPDGKYLTNIEGYSGVNYVSSSNKPTKLIAVYAPTRFYYTFENDVLKTRKTVPIVTYTDRTMRTVLDIKYTPYNTDCALPIKTAQSDGEVFTGWVHYSKSGDNVFATSLSDYDFATKIISPTALAPATAPVSDYIVPLNGEITSREKGVYRMYLPADEKYRLTVETTNSITLTINKYGATENSQTLTVEADSPQTIDLDYYVYNAGNAVYSHGYVTFNVTSLSGAFTARLTGATANTDGAPVKIDESNLAECGEKLALNYSAGKNYAYDFIGWYDGADKICDGFGDIVVDKEVEYVAKWQIKPELSAFLFTYDSGGVTITGVSDETATSIVVPDSVVKINSRAFADCSSLTSITIPDSVTSIGYNAFGGCKSLTIYCEAASKPSYWNSDWNSSSCSVVWDCKNNDKDENGYAYAVMDGIRYSFKDGVATVVKQSSNMTTAYIPVTVIYKDTAYDVTSVVNGAFSDCKSLTIYCEAASVPSGWGNSWNSSCPVVWDCKTNDKDENGYIYAVIGGIRYSLKDDVATVIRQPSNITTANIHSTVTYKNVTYSVTSIGGYAFDGCSSLTSITIPNSVTSIGGYAFSDCKSLTIYCEAASKPSGWDSRWNSSYYPVVWNCKNNDKDEDGYAYVVIDEIRYSLKDGLATVIKQPSNITAMRILSDVIYKDKKYRVTNIERDAFSNCGKLRHISVIYNNNYNNHVDYIGDNTNPYALLIKVVGFTTSLTIHEDTKYIAEDAFYGCSRLTSITIPNGVTIIGDSAFYNCSRLTSITIPNSVTSIGNSAFWGCSSLTSITIPNSVTSIGSYAFRDCGSLNYITIPNSVKSIGYCAFENCGSLTSITFNGTKRQWYGISKEYIWDYNTGNYTIHCTDGDIPKS